MAINAEITGVTQSGETDALVVDVRYYDVSTPTETLTRHTFEFATSMPLGQMQTQIINFGIRVRNAVTARQTKLQGFVGTTIAIPDA